MKDENQKALIAYLVDCEVMLENEDEVSISKEAVEYAINKQDYDQFDLDDFIQDLTEEITKEEEECVLNLGDVDEEKIESIATA